MEKVWESEVKDWKYSRLSYNRNDKRFFLSSWKADDFLRGLHLSEADFEDMVNQYLEYKHSTQEG